MNKTVSVNIGGIAFKLDEDAFQKLKRYLDAIKERFSEGKEQDEILSDIETRIAEIYSDKLKTDDKEIINIDDVDYMISIMGQPHDIGEGSSDFETDDVFETQDTSSSNEESKKSKRLFRNPDDQIIGGVASGMSSYFGIKDPIWLRLIFVILTIAGVGAMIPIYVLLWIIIPAAKTRTDKLQMRGEEANLANIEKAFKKGIENLEDSIKDLGSKKKVGRLGNIFRSLVAAILSILLLGLKFIGKFIGAILVIVGAVSLAAITIALFVNKSVVHPNVSDFTDLAFASGLQNTVFLIGVILIAGIPMLALTYGGLRIILGEQAKVRGIGLGMFGLWIVGIIMTATVAIKTSSQFSESSVQNEKIDLFLVNDDTLSVKCVPFRETEWYEKSHQDDKLNIPNLHIFDNKVFFENVALYLEKSEGNSFELEVKKRAKGKTYSEATTLAKSINYEIEQSSSGLILHDFFDFSKDNKFRDQRLSITLFVPEGKTVNLDDSLRSILKRFEKDENSTDYTAYNNMWTMSDAKFACISCGENDLIRSRVSDDLSQTVPKDNIDFDQVEVVGMVEVNLRKAESFSVEIQGEPEDTKDVEVTQDGSKLKVEVKRKKLWDNKKIVVSIGLQELKQLNLEGASKVDVMGFSQNKMNVESSGAVEAYFDMKIDSLLLDLAGASTLEVAGSGKYLHIEIDGATSLKAGDYAVEDVEVDIEGASSVFVNASKIIRGDIAGACSIRYRGTPNLSIEKSGLASISRAEEEAN